METVTILRELWRRRVLVGLVALAAILVSLLLTYKASWPLESRKYEVGVASARILVDTPSSQVVEVAPKGSETLGARANLLANLMTEGEVKATIAKRAGLKPEQLFAGTESGGALPTVLTTVRSDRQAHLLTTRLVVNPDGLPLPMIELEAQAPEPAAAARLATAGVEGLQAYLESKAAIEQVPQARRLEVTGLGAPQARVDVRGPRRLIALGAAVFVFLAGCAVIVLVSRLARGWRAAAEQEELDDAAAPVAPDASGVSPDAPGADAGARVEAQPREERATDAPAGSRTRLMPLPRRAAATPARVNNGSSSVDREAVDREAEVKSA